MILAFIIFAFLLSLISLSIAIEDYVSRRRLEDEINELFNELRWLKYGNGGE